MSFSPNYFLEQNYANTPDHHCRGDTRSHRGNQLRLLEMNGLTLQTSLRQEGLTLACHTQCSRGAWVPCGPQQPLQVTLQRFPFAFLGLRVSVTCNKLLSIMNLKLRNKGPVISGKSPNNCDHSISTFHAHLEYTTVFAVFNRL